MREAYPVQEEPKEHGKGGHAQKSLGDGGRSIHLNSTKSKDARFWTLFHERGHVLLGHLDDLTLFSYQADRRSKRSYSVPTGRRFSDTSTRTSFMSGPG